MPKVKQITISASMLALAIVFAMFFHLTGIDAMAFSPLHIPVFVCGLLCGAYYGGAVGFLVPFLALLLTGKPVLFPPFAQAMALEMAVYGAVCGIMARNRKRPKALNIYITVILAQILGRICGGALFAALPRPPMMAYSFDVFMAMYFTGTLPGIILQLALIPPLVLAIEKATKKEL